MGEGKRYTQAELNAKLEEFVGRYFGDKGTFVPSLKAMHYKAVRKGDKVKIEIDEREPLPDSDGDVIYLPHTYAGRTYDYAYIPNFISRIYFDGSSCIDDTVVPTIIDGTTKLMTMGEIFDFYDDKKIIDGQLEYIDLSDIDIRVLSHNYDTGKTGFYKPDSLMRHSVGNKKVYLVNDSDAGIPGVTEDHSIMVNGNPVKPNDLDKDFNLDIIENAFRPGRTIFKGNGKGKQMDVIDVLPLLNMSKRNYDIEYDEKEIVITFKHISEQKGNKIGDVWKIIKYPRYIKLDSDFGFISGQYIAEGNSTAQSGSITMGTNWKTIQKVRRAAIKIFGEENIRVSSKIVGSGSDRHFDYTVSFTNQHGSGIFSKLFGRETDKKCLPDDICSMPKRFIRGLIRGYLIGDGDLELFDWNLRSGAFGTISRKLASQMVFLLKYKLNKSNFRMNAYLNDANNIAYRIKWNDDKITSLASNTGDDKLIEIDYGGWVYDFEIPNTNTFVDALGGVVLHNTLREYYQMDSSRKGTTSASGYYYQFIVRQIKNRTYIFPRNEDAVNLVAVPYYGKNPEDYNTVVMDLMDFINAGGNPYDKNPTVTFRKEPVTGKFSIQTHPVKIDKTGKYNGCYDPETEILTDNGWKYFKDLEKQDKVATIDDNGNTIFVNPVDYIEYQYKGKMCKIDTKMVNLLVTPNHQMYASKRKYIKNKDYYDDFDLVEAQNLGSRFKLKLNGNWEGKETDLFKINGISKTRNIMSNNQYGSFNCDQTHNYPSLIFDMDTWMEFMGYYLSEGSVRNRNRLFISQRDLDNREKIENCLDRLEIKYHIRKDGFEINNIVLATYLTQFGKASNKFIPRELLNASKRQLMILYNALMLGDGTKNGSTYYTSSKKLANDFQELVFRIGYSAGIYIRNRIGNSVAINGKVSGYTRNLSYVVGIRRERNTPIVNIGKSRVEWVDYDDTVYCVEVPTKSHTLYVRRNGKPVWSGNCIAIHPSVALKATVDYDGDQVVVFTPSIGHAVVKLDDEELEELRGLKKSDYITRFGDFYDKARKVKYAKTEEELGVRSAQYNQETGEIENTKIQQLGGLRKRSLLFYGSKLPEPIKYGSKKDPREKMLTPELVNHVCDVEKILKMREPRWLVRELEKTKWDDLTKEQKSLVEDYHIRRELGRRLQQLVDSEKLERLMKIIQNEKSFIEDNRLIDRGSDPKGLEIQIGNRLVDRVIWQQLKTSDILIEE
jgi:hypothetical protein